MRALAKAVEPDVLVRLGPAWTAKYISDVAGGAKHSSPWSHKDIRDALTGETSGRCAYCDGPILAITFGDIEHIIPRAVDPSLVVAWANLTLACQKCNSAKSDKYDVELPFINPYVDQPADHLVFFGPIVRGSSHRGDHTVEELDLNSLPKMEARQNQVDAVEALVRIWSTAPDQTKAKWAKEVWTLASDGPYSATSLAYLKIRDFPKPE